MSKPPPPAPTASAIGPCPTISRVSRTPRYWKFTQHLRTTRPPPSVTVWLTCITKFLIILNYIYLDYPENLLSVTVGLNCITKLLIIFNCIYLDYPENLEKSGEPGLVDRVLALHAGSRGFDSHRGHMSERFFRSNRPGYPHPVSSELENSGIRVAVGDCSVTERRRGVRLIKPAKLCMCTQNTTRTDARRRVCAAMVLHR